MKKGTGGGPGGTLGTRLFDTTRSDAEARGLEALRLRVVEDFAGLFESHARTRNFVEYVSGMVSDARAALIRDIEACVERVEDPAVRAVLQEIVSRGQRLHAAVGLLNDQKQRELSRNGRLLRDTLLQFSGAIDDLSATLVKKDLFERQSKVLENIVLSHDNVTQWQSFVQDILAQFHTFFPFNFFFIAFAEDRGPTVYLYCMGTYSPEIKRAARGLLCEKVLRHLNLRVDVPLDFEEFVLSAEDGLTSLEDVETITAAVPEHLPNTTGLLGLAFASAHPRTADEDSIIRSILAVMVMVVGSSRVLSRTLSELDYYSRHDTLTGLFNRRYFNQALEQEITRSERHNHAFCVLLIDLDDFKDINDSYGHLVGDEVLRSIAETLRVHIRKGDVATRIGGDEFAIILPETPIGGAFTVAESIRHTIRETKHEAANGEVFQITLSIGVVSFPDDAENCADLLAGVDVALYQAKGLGKDSVYILRSSDKHIRHGRKTRQHAEKLRRAIQEQRIVPYYQPIIECRTGTTFGYETLARLVQDGGEVVAAGQFIDTLEKYGLGHDLDRVIIQGALKHKNERQTAGAARGVLFVNLTAQEIQCRGILDLAESLCFKYDIAPADVVFEITERDAINDMANMRNFLTLLRGHGFAFALDDFGSGYNSFHYLRELSFEYVKIDGAFVRNMLHSKVDLALVRNLSHLCRELGIRTVGESVESEDVFVVLKDIGVDYAQGFHLAMPRPTMDQS